MWQIRQAIDLIHQRGPCARLPLGRRYLPGPIVDICSNKRVSAPMSTGLIEMVIEARLRRTVTIRQLAQPEIATSSRSQPRCSPYSSAQLVAIHGRHSKIQEEDIRVVAPRRAAERFRRHRRGGPRRPSSLSRVANESALSRRSSTTNTDRGFISEASEQRPWPHLRLSARTCGNVTVKTLPRPLLRSPPRYAHHAIQSLLAPMQGQCRGRLENVEACTGLANMSNTCGIMPGSMPMPLSLMGTMILVS